MTYFHVPVLLEQAVAYLDVKPGKNYVDATLGGGGYSKEIAKRIGSGTLLAIDLDEAAHKNAQLPSNVVFFHGNFSSIDLAIEQYGLGQVAGIVADIGLSSYQLDSSGRGFSFTKDEPLDMRFDPRQELTAAALLNSPSLKQILSEYGEEKNAGLIARKLNEKHIATTFELNQCLQEILPKFISANPRKFDDVLRRVYQALRIAVNDELGNLRTFLQKSVEALAPGGRLVVVSFHSLEDRIVKHFFKQLSETCTCPPDFPSCVCGKTPKIKILTPKIIQASEREAKTNSRSISAKLRAAQKI